MINVSNFALSKKSTIRWRYLVAQVQEQQVSVSSTRNHAVTELLEAVFQTFRVLQNLKLIFFEFGALCLGYGPYQIQKNHTRSKSVRQGTNLFESDSQCGNCMVVRTTLVAREDRLVDRILKVIHDLYDFWLKWQYDMGVACIF
jgi:hypothetical protein